MYNKNIIIIHLLVGAKLTKVGADWTSDWNFYHRWRVGAEMTRSRCWSDFNSNWYQDISVMNICDISVLGTGHFGTE